MFIRLDCDQNRFVLLFIVILTQNTLRLMILSRTALRCLSRQTVFFLSKPFFFQKRCVHVYAIAF